MIHLFLQGIVLGLMISITIGPAFFAIIQTSIDRGFKSAIAVAIGVAVSDITLIFLCFLGAASIMTYLDNELYKLFIGIVGGIVLIVFGTYTFLKKPDIVKRRSSRNKTKRLKGPGIITNFFKGYFLNIMNPFLIFFWVMSMSVVTSQAESGKLLNSVIVFFSGTIAVIFSIDLIKIIVGSKLKNILRPRIQLLINRIVGLTLAVFGIALIIRVVWGFVY